MSGMEIRNLKTRKTNIEVYKSHNPLDYHEAILEFNRYCERQLPKAAYIAFIPSCFDITEDEKTVVIGGQYGNIASFDVQSSQILRDEEIAQSSSIINIIMALKDTQVVALTNYSELCFLDFPSLDILFKIHLKPSPISLKNGSIKQCLYFTNGTNEIGIIKLSREDDFYAKKFQKRSLVMDSIVNCMKMSDDGALIAVGMDNGMISIIYAENEIKLKSTPELLNKPIIISFSEGNDYIAAGFDNHMIIVWTIDSEFRLKYQFSKHTDTITGLIFARENRYIISSSLDASISIWDIKVEGLPYTLNIMDDKITNLKVSRDHQHAYYTHSSPNLMTWNIPQLPRNAIYREHTEKVNKVIFVPHSHDLISIGDDGKAIIWDYRNDYHLETKQLHGALTHITISNEGHFAIIASTKPCLYKWSLHKSCMVEVSIRSLVYSLQLSINEDYYAISDPQDRVIIYEYKSDEPMFTIKGHTLPVREVCFIKSDMYLLTASQDCTLGKWEIATAERQGTFIGHDAPVISMAISHEGLIVSGSENGVIIIWNFDCLLLYTLLVPESLPILSLYFSADHRFLISLQEHRVSYWQTNNLSLMFQIDTSLPGACLAVDSNEGFIAVAEGNTVFIEENALNTAQIRIVGKNLGSPHKFMQFVIDCQKENSKVLYDVNYNHWAIAPYMLGISHSLSYCNRYDNLNKALFCNQNRASFFSSINNEDPLSICVDLEYKNCIDICLKYMKNKYLGKKGACRNLRAYVPLESSLAKLNKIDYPYIAKLYETMFIECSESYLPRFCLHETDLPNLYLSDHLVIYPEELVPREFFSNTGRPIVFSYSSLPLDLDLGTTSSIEFLKSLLECSDTEIFRSSIVNEYLQYKWLKIKPMVYFQGMVYFIYLALLSWYIIIIPDPEVGYKMELLWVMVIAHIIMLCFEILQIATDFIDYWASVWTILDQLRSLSFSFYAIMAYQENYNYDILLAVLIFSWTRGISCFRIFDNTRYMVRLIIQVIVDITTFFAILGYATVAFAFVFYLRNPDDQSFLMYLTQAYRLDLGDFETHLTETFDWIMFFISTMINPLIMLNLLIAIMSDTAAAIAEIDDICGARELAEMILDTEKVMFWKKNLTHKHFLHKCDFFQVENSETDEVKAKIKTIKKQVITMNTTIKSLSKTAAKICENSLQKNVECLKVEQDELKERMNTEFDNSMRLISKIGNKLNIK